MGKSVIPFRRRKGAPDSHKAGSSGSRIIVRVGRQRYAIDMSCAATALATETDPAAESQPRVLQVETKFLRLRQPVGCSREATAAWLHVRSVLRSIGIAVLRSFLGLMIRLAWRTTPRAALMLPIRTANGERPRVVVSPDRVRALRGALLQPAAPFWKQSSFADRLSYIMRSEDQ